MTEGAQSRITQPPRDARQNGGKAAVVREPGRLMPRNVFPGTSQPAIAAADLGFRIIDESVALLERLAADRPVVTIW